MRTLLVLLFVAISASAISAEKRLLNFYRIESTLDTTLSKDSAIFHLDFSNCIGIGQGNQLFYSVDGANNQFPLDKTQKCLIQTTPGKHSIKLYVMGYEEIFIDSIKISSQRKDKYQINLFRANIMIEVDKPVIYAYSPIETKAILTVDIKGESPFMYPAYKEGWSFTTNPSGEITVNEKVYNYLFWEAKQEYTIDLAQNSEGSFVEGENIVLYLKEKLSAAGFNSKEKADFITYWSPRMRSNELCFVQFLFNETCNQFATMDIVPAPDNIYRIYMTWCPVSERFPITEQKIPSLDRTGFTIIEWGGIETQIVSPISLTLINK